MAGPQVTPTRRFAVCVHGATAAMPRPAAEVVRWVGSVEPDNWTGQDEWRDTT